MLETLLTQAGRYSPEHPDYRRAVLLNFGLALLALVCALFFGLNLWVFDLHSIALADAIVFVIASTLLALHWRGARLDRVAVAFVLLMAVFLLSYVWLVGNRFFGLIWLAVFPGLAVFLLGSRGGLMACLAFFGAVALVLGAQSHSWGPQRFGAESVANIAVALACLVMQALFYERSRQDVLSALRERNEALRRLSTTDALTALANRMSLEQALRREVARRSRGGEVFSVLLLDLDHFKHVNDRFGHAEGDAVLRRIAGILRREVRAPDLAGRWGGEEFVVICPHADPAGAFTLAERVRAAVETELFPGVGRQTVSIGLAGHLVEEGAEGLMARADAALYAAKTRGRNRVVAAER